MPKCKQCNSKGLFLQLTDAGICLACAGQKIREFERLLSPEMRDLISLEKKRDEKAESLRDLENRLRKIQATYDSLSRKCRDKEKELLVLGDEIEMESFSLYRPRYAFASSDEYKEKLDNIRAQQKQMIKDKTAAVCDTAWTVEGSKAKGKTLANEMIKLFLRSFNNECDVAIQAVRFNNFDRCYERIEKAFATINGLGKTNTVHLAQQYKKLKLEELVLAYEYQRKKQEEKEAAAELRAKQREDAKAAKELADARKKAEKDRLHFQQALDAIQARLAEAPDDQALKAKREELLDSLEGITAKLEDIDYRQTNQRAGYVYIISNIGSFGEGVYKIGMTRRLDPMERVYELGDASVPFRFDVHAMIFSNDAPKLEAALHNAFADKRVNAVNPRREYFRVTLDEIKAVVRENHDKTVEFVEIPDAQQYRETCRVRK